MIDEITARRIKDTADIVDVVGDFVTLKRSGKSYTGLCPFHSDRHTGSFVVTPKGTNGTKNIATCFPCGKTWDCVGFVMDILGCDYPEALRYLAKKYDIPIDEQQKYYKPKDYFVKPTPEHIVELPKRTFDGSIIPRYMADRTDAFVNWLHSIPWSNAQRERIDKVVKNYGIGHSHFCEFGQTHDFTIFWECDEHAVLHNGHFMKYKPDGHRVKDKSQYPTTWLHARMQYARHNRFDPSKEEASYCLFGQHLLPFYPQATVNIVESEKTAVVMAIAYGEPQMNIWMACCGLGNLTGNRQLLQPLMDANRRIVLYPDHDGVERWQEDMHELLNRYKRLSINANPVTQWWRPSDGDKADVADVVVRMLTEAKPMEKPPSQMDDWCERYPAFKTLNENFVLNIEH